MTPKTRFFSCGLAVLLSAASIAPAFAGSTVRLTLSGGKFQPSEPHAPANQAFTITVKNLDSKAAEFESRTLRVEKVVAPGGEVSMQIRPLGPGRYHFFDDFHQDTTEGDLIVE